MTTPDSIEPARFWEDRYRKCGRVWSGEPNELLVREAGNLAPGSALEPGCGEGADALWLASWGWQVTAVDISTTALRRAAAQAIELGLSGRVTFQHHDLGQTFPGGSFDLVAAQYLQSPVALNQTAILRQAARAVAPGGTLIITMHAGWPTWSSAAQQPANVAFPTLEGLLTALALPPSWKVDTLASVRRPAPSPEGCTGTRLDHVWRLTRTT
ncbi:class I SAM-dependent methyltransferase [Streptomyces malaysiensis]|uniref:class I SAM-dependent methyltransferase n=1 Tax=Streptomyces malaysiensis TaxID=92644 RepID=UPI002B32144E|nr:class I SAM-dependent methyltransferase [Streptomyces malaysiensis]